MHDRNVHRATRYTFALAIVFLPAWLSTGCSLFPSIVKVGHSDVPVMKGSRLVETYNSGKLDSTHAGRHVSITTRTWSFEVKANHDEIFVFFHDAFPDATIVSTGIGDTDRETIQSVLRIPSNNAKISELKITVIEGEYTISESMID